MVYGEDRSFATQEQSIPHDRGESQAKLLRSNHCFKANAGLFYHGRRRGGLNGLEKRIWFPSLEGVQGLGVLEMYDVGAPQPGVQDIQGTDIPQSTMSLSCSALPL
jgi:hypothetical protein